MRPLAIIPTYLRGPLDVEVFADTVRTLRETAGDRCDVVVVDDGSPEDESVMAAFDVCARYAVDFVPQPENEGFARTVNVGLKRCLEEGRDAVLVNADIQFGLAKEWLARMEGQMRDDDEGLASVVGALLLYPNGLIQHAGIYFSLLTRQFGHRFQYGPGNLPEAQHALACPVTGALQFIRHECLESVGLYDEDFRMGWEDVDYCVRVWLSGRQCVYQPRVRAYHHESFFRGRRTEKIERWTKESWMHFAGKYADVSFAEFVPNMLAPA